MQRLFEGGTYLETEFLNTGLIQGRRLFEGGALIRGFTVLKSRWFLTIVLTEKYESYEIIEFYAERNLLLFFSFDTEFYQHAPIDKVLFVLKGS